MNRIKHLWRTLLYLLIVQDIGEYFFKSMKLLLSVSVCLSQFEVILSLVPLSVFTLISVKVGNVRMDKQEIKCLETKYVYTI